MREVVDSSKAAVVLWHETERRGDEWGLRVWDFKDLF